MSKSNKLNRRDFVKTAGIVAATSIFAPAIVTAQAKPKRYAMVGTGHRGTGMWGKDLADNYSNEVQFVGPSVRLFVNTVNRTRARAG